MLLFGFSVFSFSVEDPVFLVTVVVVGGVFSAIVEYSTSPLAPPEGWQLAPSICVAFVMSVIWIMNIANEVLAVLETLGELWHLQLRSGRVGKLLYCCWNLDNYIKTDLDTSLLVLEWSNSIGDLVSNMAMASRRCDDGLRWVLCRTHVQSACWHWPPSFFAARSPWVSRLRWSTWASGSLLLNVGIASTDSFRYRPRLCYSLLALYASFAVLSVSVVLNHPEEETPNSSIANGRHTTTRFLSHVSSSTSGMVSRRTNTVRTSNGFHTNRSKAL